MKDVDTNFPVSSFDKLNNTSGVIRVVAYEEGRDKLQIGFPVSRFSLIFPIRSKRLGGEPLFTNNATVL